MPKGFAWLLAGALLLSGYFSYRKYVSMPKVQLVESSHETEAKPEAQSGDQGGVIGPLAQWMKEVNPLHKAEDRGTWKAHSSDHIGDSPVGTSSAIVSKTFSVAATTKFAFAIPPHAVNPQLRGKYRSFVRQAAGEGQSSDESANVDLLLMNEQQYADFLHGRPADTVYSVDSSHDQDVNFGLPATLDHPVQYYLVFRNGDGGGKKLVQADFRVDF
jgi:hypothetical protein